MAIFLPAHAWNLIVWGVPRAWGPARRAHCFFDSASPTILNAEGPWTMPIGGSTRAAPHIGYLISIPESGAGGSVQLEFRMQVLFAPGDVSNFSASIWVNGMERIVQTVPDANLAERNFRLTLSGLPASPLIEICMFGISIPNAQAAVVGRVILRATNAGLIQHGPRPGGLTGVWQTTAATLQTATSAIAVTPSPRTQVLRPVGGGGRHLDPTAPLPT